MRYPNVTSLYFVTALAFNAPTEGFPWDDLRKRLHGGQMMAKVHNGVEMLAKVSTPCVGRTNVTTDGFTTAKTRIPERNVVKFGEKLLLP